ncbi:MAG: N-6 DNA methylase [Gammaproteobacteria bacterium]|nr:N-6 DNA methylase [Gammaproteobacteria bacterium]
MPQNLTLTGVLFTPEFLERLLKGERDIKGLTPESYYLAPDEKIVEAVNRSWSRLLGLWLSFKHERAKLSPDSPATGLTRQRWLLPLFQELGYGRLIPATTQIIEDKEYPLSHFSAAVPLHLTGCGLALDKRTPGVQGAAKQSPHSLLQEFLNRSPDCLWGIASNGLRLRLLRDNISLTRQAFVEFDLEALFEGEAFHDFRLLWLLLHHSRLHAEASHNCWLERWSKQSGEQGVRAREQLRKGVEQAIQILGEGFLAHSANRSLRDALQSGKLAAREYYRQLLRLVYRLIFLFVAEDRDLLLKGDDAAKQRYRDYYSAARLRRLAAKRRGTRHSDLYAALTLIMQRLGNGGESGLALPELGGFLFSPQAIAALENRLLDNAALLGAVRALVFTFAKDSRRAVDYKNLGADELGGIYESLLELHPEIDADTRHFALHAAAGNERKTSGSYYTPTSLIEALLDSALNPVLQEALRQPEPERAVLRLKICDPACGSGHFLLAAASRVGKALAKLRSDEEEPAPDVIQHARREVIAHCLYGVDINEMAVELCKVSLWMESMEAGKPLSFLDHRIRCNNSLLGATPKLLADGIPDTAFKPIEGDDKKFCTDLRRQNKKERQAATQWELFEGAAPWERMGNLPTALARLDALPDDKPEDIHRKQALYEEHVAGVDYLNARLLADAWCAAFVWHKTPDKIYPVTEDIFRRMAENPHNIGPSQQDEIRCLARQYQFFHWHLEFPDVFRVPGKDEKPNNEHTGWIGGFDAVLGNPPWERIKLQEKEWFSTRVPEIANAANKAAREKLIKALPERDPAICQAFLADKRKAEGESHLVRNSGCYPLCGRGDVNTYALFAETISQLLAPQGRAGFIVPTGIATDDSTKVFFSALIHNKRLASLASFYEVRRWFPTTDERKPFCLLTLGAARIAHFIFDLKTIEELSQAEKWYELSAEDFRLLNPNTLTLPTFRAKQDAELTKKIYARVPVLIREADNQNPEANPWGIRFMAMFHMSNDSHLFVSSQAVSKGGIEEDALPRSLPLYEAKLIHQFDCSWATYETNGREFRDVREKEKQDPNYRVLPRYRVSEREVFCRLSRVPRDVVHALKTEDAQDLKNALTVWLKEMNANDAKDTKASSEELKALISFASLAAFAFNLMESRSPRWLLGFRDITNAAAERTVIATLIPRMGVNHKLPLIRVSNNLPATFVASLLANLDSLVLDYVARQKISGTSLTYFYLKQLPILPPDHYTEADLNFIVPRVLELTYTARDLKPWAEDLGCDGEPFRFDPERRAVLRAELDACYARLYGLSREELCYILDPASVMGEDCPSETFRVLKNNEIKQFGEYRSQRLVLESYDAMQHAETAGQACQSRLDPPPADPGVAHPPKELN